MVTRQGDEIMLRERRQFKRKIHINVFFLKAKMLAIAQEK